MCRTGPAFPSRLRDADGLPAAGNRSRPATDWRFVAVRLGPPGLRPTWCLRARVGRDAPRARRRIPARRPGAIDHVLPIAAPAATGTMAVASTSLQLQLIDPLGVDGMALARQIAMTTYRSEADFDERFGRQTEPDGRHSIVSYLDHQGRKL